MIWKKIYLGLLLICLMGTGCRTVLPPAYAVANLYPVIQPASMLQETRPCNMNLETLRNRFQLYGLMPYLEEAGFPEYEWETVMRSLNARGYAEIDARRTGRTLYFICIQSEDGRNLSFKAEFNTRNRDIVIRGRKFSLNQNQQRVFEGLKIRILKKFLADLSGISCYLEINELNAQNNYRSVPATGR